MTSKINEILNKIKEIRKQYINDLRNNQMAMINAKNLTRNIFKIVLQEYLRDLEKEELLEYNMSNCSHKNLEPINIISRDLERNLFDNGSICLDCGKTIKKENKDNFGAHLFKNYLG